jgi:hypothetical protein
MRIFYRTSDLPKKAAKHLVQLTKDMPLNSGIPRLGLGRALDVISFMNGYEHWHELNETIKRGVSQAELDEQAKKLFRKPTHVGTHYYSTWDFQSKRLGESLSVSADIARVFANCLRPWVMGNVDKNTITPAPLNNVDSWHNVFDFDFTPSARSKLLDTYTDTAYEHYMSFPSVERAEKALTQLHSATTAIPELLEAYQMEYTICSLQGDFGHYASILQRMGPAMDELGETALGDFDTEGTFDLGMPDNTKFSRAMFAYAVMLYATEEYDKASVWFNNITFRLPAMEEQCDPFLDDLCNAIPDGNRHIALFPLSETNN